MVVIRAESGGVTANRSYNIAAERQQLSEKKGVFVGKKRVCGLDLGPAHFEVLICVWLIMGSDVMAVLREQLPKSFLIGTLVHCKQ